MNPGDAVLHKRDGVGVIVGLHRNSFFIKVRFTKDPQNTWNVPVKKLEVINVEEKI